MQSTEKLQDEAHAQPPQPPQPPRSPLLRRLGAVLRDQSRFSLLTLLEWLGAYALVFTAAWVRADNVLLSGILLGVVLSGLIARRFLRFEGRRVAHYVVFALAIALGGYSGAVALREQRVRLADTLIAQDTAELEALDKERLAETKLLVDGQRARYEEHEKIRARRTDLLKSRICQLRDEARSLNLRVAVIPATSERWSPLLVLPDQRRYLHVTCDLVDCDAEQLKRTVMELTGLRLEYSPQINADIFNLHVSDMSADQWLRWIAILTKDGMEVRYENDRVIFEK